MDHRTWYTAREDGWRASKDCSAIAEEKPAALGKRWRGARHEAWADGDPGRDDETESSSGGLDGTVGSLEEPSRAGPGPKTKGAEPSGEPQEWVPSPWRPGASREYADDSHRMERVSPKAVPVLEKRVRACWPRILERGEVNRTTMSGRGCKETIWTGHSLLKDRKTVMCIDHSGCGSWWGRDRASARTLSESGRNCGARRMERDSIQRKIAWAKVLRRGDQVPPSLRREVTAVVLSQKTATVRPWRADRNWKSPSWIASSSPALIDNAVCWGSHRPEATWQSRWAPELTAEVSDQKCRSGDTWRRDTPRDRQGRSQHRRTGRHIIYTNTGASRSWRDQERWRQSWRDHIPS